MIFRRAVISVIVNIIMLALGGAPLAAREVSLADAIALMIENNPTLSASGSSVRAAQEESRAARGRRLPTLSITTALQRSNAPLNSFSSLLQQRSVTAADFAPNAINSPGYITNYSSQAILSLPLYHGGSLSAAVEASDMQVAQQKGREQQLEERLLAAVITTFISAKSHESAVDARKQEIRVAQQRLRDIKHMYQQGMALESDLLAAKAHLIQSKLALMHSQNSYSDLVDHLRQLTADSSLTIVGDVVLRPVTGSVEGWIDRALQQRSDLAVLLAQRREMAHRHDMQRAAWRPIVDLVASQQWNSSTMALRNRNSTIGATVSINLFNGGSDQAKMAAIVAREGALDARIVAKRAEINRQVNHRWRQWQEMKMEVKSARKLLAQRQEILRIRHLRHQQGLESSSELLRTQVAHDVAQVAMIRARYALLEAVTMLYLDAGMLTAEVVQ
ncbi:MAG: TolC family protein [Mariprofundales bacterium]|nr:TolC family protein [Mariprofundales bacterium]